MSEGEAARAVRRLRSSLRLRVVGMVKVRGERVGEGGLGFNTALTLNEAED